MKRRYPRSIPVIHGKSHAPNIVLSASATPATKMPEIKTHSHSSVAVGQFVVSILL